MSTFPNWSKISTSGCGDTTSPAVIDVGNVLIRMDVATKAGGGVGGGGGGGGIVTVTVAVACVAPDAFVAVSVNVVVALTVTTLLVPVTVPTPLSMESVVAELVAHVSVTFAAPDNSVGETAKFVIVGNGGAGGGGGAGGCVTVNADDVTDVSPGVEKVMVFNPVTAIVGVRAV